MRQATLDTYITQLLTSPPQPLPEPALKSLCTHVRSLLIEESNIQPVSSPVTICGDIHGQFWDLRELLKRGGMVPGRSYIFMGDFVDRGHYSLETVSLLLALKARYPDRVTLLRGNHESRQITQVYGFYDECQQKYGSAAAWRTCCSVFDFLNLAAIIDGTVLCVHGGLSPDIRTLDQIRVLSRGQEIPHEGAFCDLMWSDPDEVENWAVSPRGAGWLFGGVVTQQFNHINNLSMIARAHQLVQEGYKYMFDEQLVTVWSAPNYCYRCGNLASILVLGDGGTGGLEQRFIVFEAAEENERDRGMQTRKMIAAARSLSQNLPPILVSAKQESGEERVDRCGGRGWGVGQMVVDFDLKWKTAWFENFFMHVDRVFASGMGWSKIRIGHGRRQAGVEAQNQWYGTVYTGKNSFLVLSPNVSRSIARARAWCRGTERRGDVDFILAMNVDEKLLTRSNKVDGAGS